MQLHLEQSMSSLVQGARALPESQLWVDVKNFPSERWGRGCIMSQDPLPPCPPWFLSLNLGSLAPFVAWVSHGWPRTSQRTPHPTKHTLELLRTTLGSGFCLPHSDHVAHFATGLWADSGVLLGSGSQEAAEGSSNLWPNPRNDLATWSDTGCPITLCFHKHRWKQTNSQKHNTA